MKLNQKSLCVHAPGNHERKGAVTPIDPSTANAYRSTDDEIVYPRYFNTSNQKVVCEQLSALENAERAILFGSGMAAISTIFMANMEKGDHVLFQGVVYGGTHNFALNELPKLGVTFDFVDASIPENFMAAARPNTRLVYLESPSNPLLTITDIKTITKWAREKNLLTVIDNTFASPINQSPIDLGVDIVMHSGTKYLGGHSDICFGAVMCGEEMYQRIHKTALSLGGSLNALDCYVIERSLKTLAIRVETQNRNAQEIAKYLQNNDAISKVHYPGLESFPGHEIAKMQMRGFGGMLSFEIEGADRNDVLDFFNHLQLIFPAVSLGGVETTITAPVLTSHAKMSPEQRVKIGIKDNLLRLSVGIEDVKDLIQDLEQALVKTKIKKVVVE